MGPGHSVVDGPLVDGVKVPACVQRAEVWPEVFFLVAILWVLPEGKDANITGAH